MRLPAAVLMAVLGTLVGSSPASAAQGSVASAATITVSGNAEVVVDPDRATVTVTVDSEAMTSAAAAGDNARITAAVTNALLAAGAARSDLATANYIVQPKWQYSNNSPPKRVGYEAHNTLRVTVKQLPLLGKWIDVALGAGAARVENIEFDSSHAESSRREALAQAVANARADAEALAKAAGGKLGPLQEISTEPSNVLRAPMPVAALSMSRQSEATQIEPSPLHISAAVIGRWLFEP